MKDTKIEWCDSTWNPVTGCLHNCEYCYARRIATRFGGGSTKYTSYKATPITNDEGSPCRYELDKPARRYDKRGKLVQAPYPFDFEPTLHHYRLDQPQKWKDPQTVFVCSMADLFGDWVPDEWIRAVFTAAEKAPQHRYIFLTKNPQRLCDIAIAGWMPNHDNWWYGTSVTDWRDKFFGGSFNTFISAEPLMGDLDAGVGSFGRAQWIIIGAESGNRKNKVTPKEEWVDNICWAADLTHMAVFMKDSLIPIVGEKNMRRELPWDRQAAQNAAGDADPRAAKDTLAPAT